MGEVYRATDTTLGRDVAIKVLPPEVSQDPERRELVFSSDASGDQNLLRKGLQGSEPAAPLPGGIGQTPGDRDIAKDWIREGNTLIYLTIGGERAISAVSLDGGGTPEPLVKGFNVDKPKVDGALMVVNVRSGATGLDIGLPTTLVAARDLQAVVEGPDYNDYGVTADGQRFLVKRSVDEGNRPRLHVPPTGRRC